LLFVLVAVVFLLGGALAPSGAGRRGAPGESVAERELHARAIVKIPDREHPLWFYRRVCKKEVVPQFVAERKKENPDVDEKKLAETIVVQVYQPEDGIEIYITEGWQGTGRKDAGKLAEMALRVFSALDQSERMRLIKRVTGEKVEAEAELNEVTGKARNLDMQLGEKPEIDSLKRRLSSYREQLMEAELKRAELRTKLDLLARKASQVKDTVSVEEIAVLQKMAQDLSFQSGQTREERLRRCGIILEQKKREYERIAQLHKQGVVVEKELNDAEAELKLAENDYEMAKLEFIRLKERLDKVREDLAKAKETLAETGGLGMATIIAEKTLECETEMVAVEAKVEILDERIAMVEADIRGYRSLGDARERERARMNDLGQRVANLRGEIGRLEGRLITGVLISKSPKDYYVLGSCTQIGPEQFGLYEVVGEVKAPGSLNVLPETTILKAIQAAGGFTDEADTENVAVLRKTRVGGGWGVQRQAIDCEAIVKGEKPDDFTIEPDDTVIVPRKEPAK